MQFKINPPVYSRMFPVPVSLVDENLKLASPAQLKTILCYFRLSGVGEEFTEKDISDRIGYSTDDVVDALYYWAERGILLIEGENIKPAEAEIAPAQTPKTSTETKTAIQSISVPDPTPQEIDKRILEDENVALLFREADKILGRSLGYSGQVMLIKLHDFYGFSVEVIFTLCQYCKSINKIGVNQILSIAKIWAEREIFSVDMAEDYILSQARLNSVWNEFRHLVGIKNEMPTAKQNQCFERWTKTYGFGTDMIVFAYETAVENTGKFNLNYAEKVLLSWFEKGIKTPDEARAESEDFAKAKFGKGNADAVDTSASYDKSKYEQFGMFGVNSAKDGSGDGV